MTGPRQFHRAHPQLVFFLSAFVVNAVATLAARRAHSAAVNLAAAFDMTGTVCALYFWLVVRSGSRPFRSLSLVFSVCLLRVSILFANPWLGALAEIGAVASLLAGGVSVPLLTSELSVLYCAFAWTAKPDVPAGMTPFTLHKRSGVSDIFLMLGLASLVEIVPVHLLASHWSVKAAWILTGLSLYGAVWAVGIFRSFELRPTLVGRGQFVIRGGLLFRLTAPRHLIACVSHEPQEGAVLVAPGASPTLYIRFREPLLAERILGRKKHVQVVGLSVDDPEGFKTAVGCSRIPN